MSQSSYDRVKEQIKDSVDIVELISRFVSLRRSGRTFVGRCPWHDDSDPSLKVDQQRQSFRCYVCNIGGDVFSFIMQYQKVDFREALEFLADQYGISLPQKKTFRPQQLPGPTISGNSKDVDPNRLLQEAAEDEAEPDLNGFYSGTEQTQSTKKTTVDNPSADKQNIDKKTLYKTLDWVQSQYHQALLTLDEAKEAREYLAERGISQQSISKFRLGYAPQDRNWLLKKVDNSPRRIACLEAAGILARFQNEDYNANVYDRFRGRLLFPIQDELDRTIAFGGRLLPNSSLKSSAKYVNSPETAIFIKSKHLYGLNLARLAMRNTERVLIMEGYTDCIMSHQVGLEDAVAVLGTAVGSNHVKILRRYVKKMVLVLDGDKAGQKRTNEVLELFVAEGVDLSVLTLPQGCDPCEFLLEQGKENFEELLQFEAKDALEHAFRNATQNIDLENDIVPAAQALDQLVNLIANAPINTKNLNDPLQLRIVRMITKLAQKFNVPEQEVRNRLKFWQKQKSQAPKYRFEDSSDVEEAEETPENAAQFANFALLDALEREMLELWFADPNTFAELDNLIPDDWIVSPLTLQIQKTWREIQEQEQQCSFSRLLVHFDDPKVKNLLLEIDESAAAKGLGSEMEPEKRTQLINEIVQGLTRREMKRRNPRDINELKSNTLSKEEKQRKLQEILQRAREEHKM